MVGRGSGGSFRVVENQASDEFSDSGDDCVSEGVQFVEDQPAGNPMSHSIHRGFR